MELRYSLTPGDIADLSLDTAVWPGAWRRYLIPVIFSLAATYLAFLAWSCYGAGDWFGVILFLVFAIVALFMGLFFGRPMLRLIFLFNAALNFDYKLTKNVTVIATPDSIASSNSISKSTTRWDGVERISSTTKHVFIYLSRRAAIVVPARVFKSTEEFHSFVHELRRYHEVAVTPMASEGDCGAEEKGERV